jgi:hypothetical protein
MLEEVGVGHSRQQVPCQALGVREVGAEAVPVTAPSPLLLVLQALVVGAGVGFLEHQVAPAL